MFRTAVPETAVHKYGDTCLTENKIRLAKDFLIPPPAGDSVASKEPYQGEFRILVAASANPRHDIGTLGF